MKSFFGILLIFAAVSAKTKLRIDAHSKCEQWADSGTSSNRSQETKNLLGPYPLSAEVYHVVRVPYTVNIL